MGTVRDRMSNQYGSVNYWNSRFSSEDQFDWYHKWNPTLKKQFGEIGLVPESAVLNVGCGNSGMSREMYDDGYENITNLDFSQKVITAMKVKNSNRQMQWIEGSVQDMTGFAADGEYDFIIDKGCLDCILCGEKSTSNLDAALAECARVLKPGGMLLSISFADDRNEMFNQPDFNWTNCGESAAGYYRLPKPEASNVPKEAARSTFCTSLKRTHET